MHHRLAILLLPCSIMLMASTAWAETLNIYLVLSGSTQPYQQFSAELNKALAKSKARVAVTELQVDPVTQQPANTIGKADLIVAVGTKATELAIAESRMPLLSIMVPKNSFEMLAERHSLQRSPRAIGAIYLDQPLDRQLNFIQALLPMHSIVGMLYSPDMPISLPRLPRGMSVNVKSVRSTETLFAVLENILNSSDVLLAIPDSQIYSSSNVRNILLTSYRYKVPLIGISQSYVNAGALGAIFSTPEQMAEQAGEMIVSFSNGEALPEPQYPASFSIALNQQVARSLGINLPSTQTILERMGKAGEGGR